MQSLWLDVYFFAVCHCSVFVYIYCRFIAPAIPSLVTHGMILLRPLRSDKVNLTHWKPWMNVDCERFKWDYTSIESTFHSRVVVFGRIFQLNTHHIYLSSFAKRSARTITRKSIQWKPWKNFFRIDLSIPRISIKCVFCTRCVCFYGENANHCENCG